MRAVLNSWTTSGASTGESSKDQHSSSTGMLGCPLFPEARSAMAFAINMLIAVSRWKSEFNPSTLKNSQLFSVRMLVCPDFTAQNAFQSSPNVEIESPCLVSLLVYSLM